MRSKLLAIGMTISLCAAMTACGSAGSAGTETAASAESGAETDAAVETETGSEGGALGGENVAIANPWVYTEDKAEAESMTGLSMYLPEGAQNVMYGVLTTDNMLEIQFTDEAGSEFYARAEKTDSLVDISGTDCIVITWDDEEDCTIVGWPGTLKSCLDCGDGTSEMVCLWYDENMGVSYAMTVTGEDLDGFDPVGMAECIYGVKE